MLYIPYPFKRCTKCGGEFPPTTQYFYRRNGQLIAQCKSCRIQTVNTYSSQHHDKQLEYSRKSRKLAREKNPEKARAYDKQSRERNRIKRAQSTKEWRRRNKEHVYQYGRNYAQFHKKPQTEKQRARMREYMHMKYHANPEAARAKARTAYRKDREKILARGKRYRKAHPENKRLAEAKRRAQKKRSNGKYTRQDMMKQYAAQKGKCYYCKCELGSKYHLDHVVPLSRGGSHEPSNIVLACPTCNSRKRNRLPHEWPEGGRLL